MSKVPVSFRIDAVTRDRIDGLATLLKLEKGEVLDELVRFYLEKREQPVAEQINSLRKLMSPKRTEGKRAA